MPIHNCPCCRCDHDDDADRAARITDRIESFTRDCERLGYRVEANRVDPRTAANLLGMKPKTFNGWRTSGDGPRAERIPVNRSQYSYDLNVLAAWSVDQRIEKKF
ncbi:hypothetical protein I6J77_11185 [Rhodanobacter sp. FDAARGOS 1247]|uniref:hypothetical protein n=1 Tax=Rhodanobacter sp. FDAARGOS 1247 TaxID=2778082 RepID=UPI00195264B3|nr:hypothetical protein [Rhodanobacter sp. FDAARGOS 1247]QRP62701.1 hypothetical protein I6J77_11185 [Rhodanobacter sp. FDAARGOS 1247]